MDQYGPFVMNPQVEIDMTIEDIHNVKDGFANGQVLFFYFWIIITIALFQSIIIIIFW